ncbi:MAG TPA: DUF58 domain-containing protein [Candidatus Sulfomarinibacteraceae bacterium]|nr:DUF58 domain-containing protein [Candidatus Sulfomarinibacteraceae bacterium]
MRQRRTVVLILAVLALIGGLATGRDILFNLAYLFTLLLIISFFWAWANINWVHISRVTRARRTQVGRPLEERFTVRNTSAIPKLWLEVRDFSSVPAHHASHVVSNLGGRAGYSWRVTTICTRRGRYKLGPMLLASSDPFGFFPMERELTPTTNVVVYPLTVEIQQFALPVGILPGGDALRRRTHYVTTNAAGVREYAPGDSFGRIHWPSTARRNRLIVKEFELDPLADIWVVPDMSSFEHVSRSEAPEPIATDNIPLWMKLRKGEFTLPESTEEYMVTVAASLAQYFLRSDRALGMLAYGQSHEIVQPDRGERQLNRILETLSVLRAQGNVPLADVLEAESHLLPRGTTVIVVSPTTSEYWITAARQQMRRGLRVVTVLINPESFGGPRSNKGLAELLRASGVDTYFVNNGDDLTEVLSSSTRPRYYTVA